MRIVFFNIDEKTEKLAYVNTDDHISKLVENGIIIKGSAYLEMIIDENNMSNEEKLMLNSPEKLIFDNYKNPSKVMFDMDIYIADKLSEIREIKNLILKFLDGVQIRALAENRLDINLQINKDKQVLRDLTDNIDLNKIKSPIKIIEYMPECFSINYKLKYDTLFKG
jgi:hypothetical protein